MKYKQINSYVHVENGVLKSDQNVGMMHCQYMGTVFQRKKKRQE